VKDGKLNLHKLNGVKIAVPVSKMSLEDLEYVERATGLSLDEVKPLSELKKKNGESSRSTTSHVGATIQQPKKPDYDWFQFFLGCDVQVGLCERYAQAFTRDSMDESVLPDVDASVLRNLGLREGDIIKVMRFLDNKYGRTKKSGSADEGEGGLFSGPGGTLRNNTRKGRPAPPVETNNVVDPKAFSKQSDGEGKTASPTTATAQGGSSGSAPSKPASGFDDDAWSVKPVKTQASESAAPAPARALEPAPAPAPVAPKTAPLTGSMQELSLLTQPLQPEKVQPPPPAPPVLNLAPAPAPAPAQLPQPTGATPQFFSGMQPPVVNGQQVGQPPQALARQRPLAPQYTQGQGALVPPPPARPLSAPQSAQASSFTPPPLQPQMTGYPTQVAPPGQSLNDIAQVRLRQQYTAMQMQAQPQPQQVPMMPMMTGMPVQQGFPGQFIPQPTGMMNGPQVMQPAQQFGQIPMQTQPTGFGGFGQQPQPAQGFGVNAFLPPPLEPQRTAVPQMQMPQPTGFGGFGQPPQQHAQQQGFGMGGAGPSVGGTQPLVPQQTGPPPPVRFGVNPEAKKIAPQPTGRRANLAAASKFFFPPCF
jgi:actin cytoskeleton-regulatory complex protein SLA1